MALHGGRGAAAVACGPAWSRAQSRRQPRGLDERDGRVEQRCSSGRLSAAGPGAVATEALRGENEVALLELEGERRRPEMAKGAAAGSAYIAHDA